MIILLYALCCEYLCCEQGCIAARRKDALVREVTPNIHQSGTWLVYLEVHWLTSMQHSVSRLVGCMLTTVW